jgi:RNA polymerase sigma-70 factor (ECF subfamily)
LADEGLVSRSQAGDQAAFTEIVRRYKDRVYWLVRRMVGSSEDEDITQEVFLRAYQAIPRLRSGATLKTWLFRIAHNLCVTEIHRRGRRGEHVSLEDEGEERIHHLLPGDTGRLEQQIERQELSGAVQRLVAKMPAHYRAVLTLYYVEEAKYEEIAEIMGLPMGTVKTHIHRARLRLRDLVLAEIDPVYLPEGSSGRPSGAEKNR